MTGARYRRRGFAVAVALLLAFPIAEVGFAADDALDVAAARAIGSADVVSWWAQPGGPAWMPGAEQGGGFPWVLAGHAIGGWTLDEPLRASLRSPWPGVTGAQPPLAWTVRLSERWLGSTVWTGPGSGLTQIADSIGTAPAGKRAISSSFSLARGSSAEERNALRLAQRDSLRTFVAEIADWKRGGTGEWQDAAAHLYGFGFSSPWRAVRLEGAFGQRGSAGSVTSGEEESVTGYGGFARLRAPLAGGEGVIELGRDLDTRDTFGGLMFPGHRDAQQSRAEAEWSSAPSGAVTGARIRFTRSEVVQQVPAIFRTEWSDDAVWVTLRHRRPLAGGSLEASVGGGTSSAAGALGPSPSLAWERGMGGARLRLVAGRAVTPAWSDLAPGVEAFVQSAWSGGAEADIGRPGRRLVLGARVGSTEDRAIVPRLPITGWWLREGVTRDGESWNFALGTLGAVWAGEPGALRAEFHALARQDAAAQPAVDPALGGRASAEVRRRFFSDDLDVRLRGEVAYVGERESEALVPRVLPGYATFGAALVLTLADVTVVTDVRGLEDVRRPEVWIHPLTGVEALGPGREFRVSLSWRLFD